LNSTTFQILILEDNSDDAFLLLKELNKSGLKIITKRICSEDALNQEILNNKWDMVISDYSMPELDVYDALRIVSSFNPEIPIIVVSGMYGEDRAVDCMRAGAHDYLTKNNLARLVPAVKRELAESLIRKENVKIANRLFSLISAINDVFFTIDHSLKFNFLNNKCEEFFGYPIEYLIGKQLNEITPFDSLIDYTINYNKAIESNTNSQFEFFIEQKNSWVDTSIYPNSNGAFVYIRNITEKKQLDLKIKEQADLLEKTSDGVVVLSIDGMIKFWNTGAEAIYEWNREEVFGKNYADIIVTDKIEWEEINKNVLKKSDWRGTVNRISKSGKKLEIDARWTVVKDEKGLPISFLIILTDKTKENELETKFLRVQRMENIGSLAAGISHDLNNIFSPLTMGFQLLLYKKMEDSAYSLIKMLQENTQRGADLVKHILTFSRGTANSKVDFYPQTIVNEIIKLLGGTFDKSIKVTFNSDKNIPKINGDPTNMHQIIMNLCVNARDAMPNGGVLDISLTYGNKSFSGLETSEDELPIIISISDSGSGIPVHVREKIFDQFFTTKEESKGTGLGLSTVKSLVEQFNGTISFKTEMGKGTTFELQFPVSKNKRSEENIFVETDIELSGHGETILIIDDEKTVLDIMKNILETFGYKVLAAADGSEAVSIFAEHSDEISVVITDFMMPILDGVSVIKAMRVIKPNVKAIIQSGTVENEVKLKLMEIGHEDYLRKPFTAELLLHKIKKLIKSTDNKL